MQPWQVPVFVGLPLFLVFLALYGSNIAQLARADWKHSHRRSSTLRNLRAATAVEVPDPGDAGEGGDSA